MNYWADEMGATGSRKLLIIICMVAAILLGGILRLVLSHGFPIPPMDIDDDSFISPGEFLNSIELWHRPVRAHDDPCMEIFRLKDGLGVKVVCEES